MVDETRRDTYKLPVALGNERPLVATVEDEFKQLLAVGISIFLFLFLQLSSTRECKPESKLGKCPM